jgi:methyl-accepting chemotaxis protein
MAFLGRFSLRAKLLALLACSTLAILITIAASDATLRERMMADRAEKLETIVEAAESLAEGLEQQVAAQKITREEAMARLANLVHTVRFDNGKGYLIVQKGSVIIMHGLGPNREGRHSLTPTIDGRILSDVIEATLASQKSAFFRYSTPKPGEAEPSPKISFASTFEPWGVIFMAGAYLDDLDTAFASTTGKLAAAGAGILIVSLLIAYLVSRDISLAIGDLQVALGRLARRDLEGPVPRRDRKDELGAMAMSVQTLKDALLENQTLEAKAAAAHEQVEAERLKVEAERSAAAAKQSEVMDALGAALARMSHGDLTTPIDQPFATEYEQLRHDYNAALDSMRVAITEIVESASELRSGSQEITQAADELSRTTEQQAAGLQKAATTMGQITEAVHQTAQGVEQARDSVVSARSVTDRSGDVVRKAVAAMGEIEHSANQISQIIGVIDEIAFQTNLLALNAGVEAARAGDAGRGFAVVASEVRALAQRSGEAAREIKGLIGTSTEQVGRGVALVDETGRALGEIAVQVTDIDAVVGQIAISAKEQASSLGEISRAINAMDQVTQQNATMVQQSTAASHSLVEQSGKLVDLTKRFRIGADAPTPRIRPQAKPTTAKLAPRPRPTLVRQATAAASDWEEF